MKSTMKLVCSLLVAALQLAPTAGYSSYSANAVYGYNLFADTSNNYYDGYQQAWRYLGWYVKCGYPSDRYEDNDSNSHSGSEDNGNDWVGNNYCQRYLIWAAVSTRPLKPASIDYPLENINLILFLSTINYLS